MGQSASSEAISPTTRRGPDVNLATASTLGAFQHVACHQCTHHRQLIAEFWVGERCSACVEAWSTCLEWLPYLEVWGLPWPNTTPPFPPRAQLDNAATSYTPPPLHFVCFKGFMVDVKAWAGCICSLTQLVCKPDCMILVPVLLTWHSTLYNRHPLHTIATYKVWLLREGCAW
jgi:hypothetical protein